MKLFLKRLGSGFTLLIGSWWLAYFWMRYGESWLNKFTELISKIIYPLVRPILSAEVWEAEEQLDFLGFWLLSFVGTILIMVLIKILGKRLRPRV